MCANWFNYRQCVKAAVMEKILKSSETCTGRKRLMIMIGGCTNQSVGE